MHDTVSFEERLRARQELPIWKSGYGINDWNEEIVEGILNWLKVTFPKSEWNRADAIAYIARRQNPNHEEYPALVARCQEIQTRLDRKKVVAAVEVLDEAMPAEEAIAAPDEIRDRFSQLRNRMKRG